MLALQVGGDERQGRRLAVHDDRCQLVGDVGDPLPIEAQDVRRVVHHPGDRSGQHDGPDRVEPELELGDDPEVAAGTTQAPEQVGVLVGAGLHELAFRSDHVDRQQLVDRQPVLAHEPADAAAQGQPRQPSMGDDAGRDSQSELLRLPVEVAEPDAGLRPRGASVGVDADAALVGARPRHVLQDNRWQGPARRHASHCERKRRSRLG